MKTEAKTEEKDMVTGEEGELVCKWQLETECDGDIDTHLIFKEKARLKIPMCMKHFDEHKEIMLMHRNSYEVEDILNMKPDERKRISQTIILSGIDKIKNVEE